jgi:hypothetical protein
MGGVAARIAGGVFASDTVSLLAASFAGNIAAHASKPRMVAPVEAIRQRRIVVLIFDAQERLSEQFVLSVRDYFIPKIYIRRETKIHFDCTRD